MAQRLQLQTLLEEVLGSQEVYFQPPANVQMKYPSIVYKRDAARTEHADNAPYKYKKRYTITYMDTNPDSEIPDKLAMLPGSAFNRHFTANNLNHDVFTLYF